MHGTSPGGATSLGNRNMSRKQQLVIRESPQRAMARIRAAVNPNESDESVLPPAEVAGDHLYGWVTGRSFALSVRRDNRKTFMRLNSWDPWLIGSVETTSQGTVVVYRLDISPGLQLWWRVVTAILALAWLLPLGLWLFGTMPVPLEASLGMTLGPVGFYVVVRLIGVVAMRENRAMWDELRQVVPGTFSDVATAPVRTRQP